MNKPNIPDILILLKILLIVVFCQSAAAAESLVKIPGEDRIQHATVNNFAMTSDGRLWMCTENGLMSYDGVHSAVVDVSDGKSQAKNIKSLVELPDGSLLIGSDEGLFLKHSDDDGHTIRLHENDIPQASAISLLADGSVCVATNNSVLLMGQDFTVLEKGKTDNLVVSWLLPTNEAIYIGTDKGLYKFHEGKVSPSVIEGLPTVSVDRMLEVPGKLYLFSKEAQSLYVYSVATRKFESIPTGSIAITGMVQLPEKEILLATNGDGIMRLDEKAKRLEEDSRYVLLSKNGNLCKQLYSLFLSREGQLFAGYYKLGAAYSIFNSKFFDYYSAANFNSQGLSVRCVADTPDYMAIGTRNGAYVVNKATDRTTHLTKGELGSNLVTSASWHGGMLYLGTFGGGVHIYDPAADIMRKVDLPAQKLSVEVTVIRHDRYNNLYVCTTEGIYVLKGDNFVKLTDNKLNGKTISIFEIFFDASGRFWACTSNGIYLCDKETGKLTRAGLPDKFPVSKDVRQMYETSSHNLVLITDSGEIIVLKENLQPSEHQENLSVINEARGVVQDKNGYLWITTTNGLYRYNTQAKVLTLYDDTEGIPNLNFNPGSPVITSAGELLLCNTDGLLYANVSIPRETRMGHRKAYPSLIETVRGRIPLARSLDDQGRFVIDLQDYENHVKIYFSDFSFTGPTPNPNRYQYTVDGGETWRKFDTDMSMLATGLKKGENIIKVRQIGNPATETVIVINNKNEGNALLWLLIIVSVTLVCAILFLVRLLWKNFHKKGKRDNAEVEASPAESEPEAETPAEAEADEDGGEQTAKKKYAANYISEKECEHLVKRMNALLKESKIYTNPDLKIADVAQHLGLSSHKVSYVLSQYLNTNYYDFIYAFRIEEFKHLAKADKKRLYSLTALSEKAGFNSRATFFRAFKKKEGITPGEYMKNLWEE